MNEPSRTFTLSAAGLDVARRAAQLAGCRMYIHSHATDPVHWVQYAGRHADEAESLLQQMLLRTP